VKHERVGHNVTHRFLTGDLIRNDRDEHDNRSLLLMALQESWTAANVRPGDVPADLPEYQVVLEDVDRLFDWARQSWPASWD
jgi:hypothetical protein